MSTSLKPLKYLEPGNFLCVYNMSWHMVSLGGRQFGWWPHSLIRGQISHVLSLEGTIDPTVTFFSYTHTQFIMGFQVVSVNT